jgi:tetratricopeptide (TPR) repeat protein
LQLNDNKDIELWVQYIDYIKTNISVKEIENIFKEAINKATKDVYKETFYLLYAKILKENNEIDKAISLLKDGYNKTNRENILFALVKLYDMKKLYEESIYLLKEGKKNSKFENNSDIIINLIKEYMNIDNIEQALSECHFGLTKFPLVDEFYLLNTDLLSSKTKKENIKEEEKKKYLEEATNTLRNGIKLIPQSYKLYIKLSEILYEIGQVNQARAIIDKGLGYKNNVDCSILYKEQILLENKIGNKNLAKSLLSKALKKFRGTKDEEMFKDLEQQIYQS